MTDRSLESELTAYFESEEYEPITTSGLVERFAVAEAEIPALLEMLHRQEAEGRVCHLEGRGWFAPRREGWIVGSLSVNRRGHGFVRPSTLDPKGDIYISAGKLKDAHHGDLVLVKSGKPKRKERGHKRGRQKGGRRPSKPVASPQGKKREGRIVHVLQRSGRAVEGIFRRGQGSVGVVEPFKEEIGREIWIAAGRNLGAKDGDRVLARLVDGPAVDGLPPGEVVVLRAEEGSWQADLELIMAEYELEDRFPADVELETDAMDSTVTEEEIATREDRRDELVITIDPVDAKDFDDAITVEAHSDGSFRLGVFIADVSHFVRPDTAVDREARDRATSVYLPGRVIPMLPERLSNGLCSLRPDEDRLAKGVWMEVSASGELMSWTLERSVIRSQRRFTYGEVQEILDGGPALAGEDHFAAMIRDLEKLRTALNQRRMERGALDLDLPSQRLLLDDDGEIIEIGHEARDPAHNLVEECMLLANEAVARAATARRLPIVRRSHPAPPEDDLEVFQRFCRVVLPTLKPHQATDLQRIADHVRGKPIAQVVGLALLRTLTRAEYVTEKSVHFALALDEYCHFTSPIRRYPDLQVHRALDRALFNRPDSGKAETPEELIALAEHCSMAAREAEQAEREMSRLRSIHWLQQHVGERFAGVVISVSDFGFFVRLDGNLVEGRVPLAELHDDFYVHWKDRFELRGQRSGRRFRLGDRLEVEVLRADPLRREVDLGYRGREESDDETPPRRRRR